MIDILDTATWALGLDNRLSKMVKMHHWQMYNTDSPFKSEIFSSVIIIQFADTRCGLISSEGSRLPAFLCLPTLSVIISPAKITYWSSFGLILSFLRIWNGDGIYLRASHLLNINTVVQVDTDIKPLSIFLIPLWKQCSSGCYGTSRVLRALSLRNVLYRRFLEMMSW